jgi:hypothetical protein
MTPRKIFVQASVLSAECKDADENATKAFFYRRPDRRDSRVLRSELALPVELLDTFERLVSKRLTFARVVIAVRVAVAASRIALLISVTSPLESQCDGQTRKSSRHSSEPTKS